MTVRRPAAASVAMLLALAVSGCASLETRQHTGSRAPALTGQELLSSLVRRNEELKSLRSLARVSYRVGTEKGGFQGAIVVGRPDRLRLEAFSMFGTALVVTADAEVVTGFHPGENRFYRGESSRENLFRYTQLLLDLKELTALLVGMPPIEADSAWEVTRNTLRRRLPDGSLDRVELNEQTGVPVRWERFTRRGETEFSARFDEFSKTSSVLFPMKISFAAPALERHFEVRYDEPELNTVLPDAVFVQNMPDNAVEVPLQSLGG